MTRVETFRRCFHSISGKYYALFDNPDGLAGAAIDTFVAEGEIFSSPLIGYPTALLTPHMAGTTFEALRNASADIVERIACHLSSKP